MPIKRNDRYELDPTEGKQSALDTSCGDSTSGRVSQPNC